MTQSFRTYRRGSKADLVAIFIRSDQQIPIIITEATITIERWVDGALITIVNGPLIPASAGSNKYVYTWDIPITQPLDTYVVSLLATVDSLPAREYIDIEIIEGD